MLPAPLLKWLVIKVNKNESRICSLYFLGKTLLFCLERGGTHNRDFPFFGCFRYRFIIFHKDFLFQSVIGSYNNPAIKGKPGVGLV